MNINKSVSNCSINMGKCSSNNNNNNNNNNN